jgi:hypothetical protein
MARAARVGLAAVVAQGDRRASLEAIRDHLAKELEDAPATVAVAPIAKQLADVIRELESLPGARKDSKSDELASRRAARRAKAAGL